ncbi:MAG: Eco29kI family restriction endonuclease [Pirellulales bacterium]
MRIEQPFNPLDKKNLGESVAEALLAKVALPLPLEERFIGAGIYALYYLGDFPLYAEISKRNKAAEESHLEWPIYIGKAIPKGARQGGVGLDASPGTVLYSRIAEHAESIVQSANLDIAHFTCRFLAVEDIWIPLGESLLIQRFGPVWNKALDGFGNHAPGKGRYKQQRSPWDTLHPGRGWAKNCAPNETPIETITETVTQFILQRLP